MLSALQAALRYAQAGYRVLPVWGLRGKACACPKGAACPTPGKHPSIVGWQRQATTDAAKVKAMFTQRPDAHVGVMAPEGCSILDIDPRNGGKETYKALMNGHATPITPTQRSGGGGVHLIFKGEPIGPIGKGIDVKRHGNGFVVVYPSGHASGGKYEWKRAPWDVEPAPLPPALQGAQRQPTVGDKHATSPPRTEHVRAALAHLPADDYATWVKYGQALRHDYGEQARELWVEWSRTSSKWQDTDAAKWRTFDKNSGATPVTAWSILVDARARGYAPEFEATPAANDWPPPLDLAALGRHEPVRPAFIMDDWLPCGYATLLAGHGGVGKSGIALHLAVCIAAGKPFFGVPVERRRVLYLSCEDREAVLHWRLVRICGHTGIPLASLRGWLQIVDLVGHDTVLWERDPRTGRTATGAFARLTERVRQHDIDVLMVDGISDTFAGNENARAEVKRFVNSLVALVPAATGAVLLVGHVSKPSAASTATSEGYSGSTGWHNSVRARWYLYPDTQQSEDGGRAERTGELTLELQKSNLGRVNQEMRFAWDEQAHLFVGRRVEAAGSVERAERDEAERRGIVAAFKACAAASVSVPAATTGRRTAYHVLAARAEFPETLRTVNAAVMRRFWRHIEALRAMSRVRESSIRRADRHRVVTLELATQGRGHAGNA